MALPKWATTVTPFSKILAMIIFISFPIMGFFLGMKYQQTVTVSTLPYIPEVQKTVFPTPTTIKVHSPTSNPIDTSGWKTYVNSIFGYSYLYPSIEKINENGKYSVDGVFVDIPNTTSLSGGTFQLTISVEKNSNNITFNDLKKEKSDPSKSVIGGKIDILTIGGENAVGTVEGGPWGAYGIYTIHNGYVYRLLFEPGLDSSTSALLDSFKFIK